MALRRDDDLGPALLALGALTLGIVALVAIWGLRTSPAERAREARRRATTEGGLEHAWAPVASTDAGVGGSPLAHPGFALTEGFSPSHSHESDPIIVTAPWRGPDTRRSTGCPTIRSEPEEPSTENLAPKPSESLEA